MLALVAMGLTAASLGRMRAARRPLPLAARRTRPVPVVMLLSLVLPMLPQLVLMHADAQLLPALLLLLASAGAGTAGAMLLARRQLAGRLRWALGGDGLLGALPDGTLATAELEARRLVAPSAGRGRTAWYRADLLGHSREGEAIRVALEGAVVDIEAAREIASVTFGADRRLLDRARHHASCALRRRLGGSAATHRADAAAARQRAVAADAGLRRHAHAARLAGCAPSRRSCSARWPSPLAAAFLALS